MSEWRTIDIAPKDGRVVLCFGHGAVLAMEPMRFYPGEPDDPLDGYWGWLEGDMPRKQPTHWMPLPEPPK